MRPAGTPRLLLGALLFLVLVTVAALYNTGGVLVANGLAEVRAAEAPAAATAAALAGASSQRSLRETSSGSGSSSRPFVDQQSESSTGSPSSSGTAGAAGSGGTPAQAGASSVAAAAAAPRRRRRKEPAEKEYGSIPLSSIEVSWPRAHTLSRLPQLRHWLGVENKKGRTPRAPPARPAGGPAS